MAGPWYSYCCIWLALLELNKVRKLDFSIDGSFQSSSGCCCLGCTRVKNGILQAEKFLLGPHPSFYRAGGSNPSRSSTYNTVYKKFPHSSEGREINTMSYIYIYIILIIFFAHLSVSRFNADKHRILLTPAETCILVVQSSTAYACTNGIQRYGPETLYLKRTNAPR